MKWLITMILLGMPATADHVPDLPAIEALETCIGTKVSAEECISFVYTMCEGTDFFGAIEGAGRGWCEGHVRDLWEIAVSRAENARLCANKDSSLELPLQVAAEGANRAWRNFRDAECQLASVRDTRGVGGGESTKTKCLALLSSQRLDALRAEQESCE